ncbi:hypothetical protein EVAR_83538_1 [Eumeta japonica]|uniref:Uncharacterized protein n=1 Tax=Eumeta variegata TaxID=151549 RepID=A0A4C1ZHB4_EUMVA|nr:hypothetical protein EVAR_83538_1 [Eumeta japonica]
MLDTAIESDCAIGKETHKIGIENKTKSELTEKSERRYNIGFVSMIGRPLDNEESIIFQCGRRRGRRLVLNKDVNLFGDKSTLLSLEAVKKSNFEANAIKRYSRLCRKFSTLARESKPTGYFP